MAASYPFCGADCGRSALAPLTAVARTPSVRRLHRDYDGGPSRGSRTAAD